MCASVDNEHTAGSHAVDGKIRDGSGTPGHGVGPSPEKTGWVGGSGGWRCSTGQRVGVGGGGVALHVVLENEASAVIGQLAADGGSRKLVARGQMRALRRVGLVRRDNFFCHTRKTLVGGLVSN